MQGRGGVRSCPGLQFLLCGERRPSGRRFALGRGKHLSSTGRKQTGEKPVAEVHLDMKAAAPLGAH